MNSLKLGSVVSTRPMAVFVDNEPKLRKTPFCKTNAATWLPEGWSLQTKSVSAQHLTWTSLFHLEYAVKTFPGKIQICMTHLSSGKGASKNILKVFTPLCESENKSFENWKTGIARKYEISSDDVVFWQYFIVSFFPNIHLFSFLVTQKDAPERHEKAEKKPPPKGIYFKTTVF